MRKDFRRKTAGLVLVAAMAAAAMLKPGAAMAEETAVQPEAIKALTGMGAYLRTLKSFTLAADTVQDDELDNGQKIQISGRTTYQVRTPDRLRLTVDSDTAHRVYYYDGKTVTQFAPEPNLYAVFDAPDTIAKTIDLARSRYGLSLPIADLFWAGADDAAIKKITSARLVGVSMLDGQACNHFAFRLPRVDFQLWIRKDGDPAPCELVVTDRTDPAGAQNGALISIDATSEFPDSTFVFVPPAGASKITIEPVAGASTGSN